ncbi:MAG: CPBP family intramembrane metalloprotease [Proteobacteria bacterium]|nr:CPBP family intramembrane metalloprotease [Pseudomonadota bacterium]
MNEAVVNTARKSLNDVRAPMMMLYVLAYFSGRMSSIPLWVVLIVGSAALIGIALIFERRALHKMLWWDLKSVLFGLALALLLHVLMSRIMQIAATITIGTDTGIHGEGIPGPLEMLLTIRFHVDRITPVLAGLGGALLLAPSEEIFWRGFVQTRLVDYAGRILGVVISVILYSGFWAVLLNPLAALAAALSGCVFSILSLRSGTLIPAMISHAVLWVLGIWILPLY